MTTPLASPSKPPSESEIISDMAERLVKMETFIRRRFDEISTEIHATTEILDMAETGIETRFSEILKILGAISFRGDGSSPHNVGVELNAVVKTTEDAANRILDASTDIASLLQEDAIDWSNPDERAKMFQKIRTQTDDILTACAFQDLTGQRIGKTLENIRKAESELSEMLKKMGVNVDMDVINVDYQAQSTAKAAAATPEVHPDNLSSQDDIDALFK